MKQSSTNSGLDPAASVLVVLTIASDEAIQLFAGRPIFVVALDSVYGFARQLVGAQVVIALPPLLEKPVQEILRANQLEYDLLICDPTSPKDLAANLLSRYEVEIFVVHEAVRPLVSVAQFDRALQGLRPDVDAVRPGTLFTETLKAVDSSAIIQRTIDRTQVYRISTPEVIARRAIDLESERTDWLLALKVDARTEYVESDPETLRVNSADERILLESFLHWQQRIVR